MKICPVCNDSFADTLNFCDIDGARLTREGSVQERNKWWSLIGAGLLVGALVISAASIFFLPKARVSAPIVNSEPAPVPAPSKPASPESPGNVAAAQVASAEPEGVSGDAPIPEVKKKDKALVNGNFSATAPNPKAAALAAEEADKKPTSAEGSAAVPAPLVKPEPVSSAKGSGDTHSSDAIVKTPTTPELKKDPKPQPTNGKSSEKDPSDKKKPDEKEKKKGGFLRVFKKIFGQD